MHKCISLFTAITNIYSSYVRCAVSGFELVHSKGCGWFVVKSNRTSNQMTACAYLLPRGLLSQYWSLPIILLSFGLSYSSCLIHTFHSFYKFLLLTQFPFLSFVILQTRTELWQHDKVGSNMCVQFKHNLFCVVFGFRKTWKLHKWK